MDWQKINSWAFKEAFALYAAIGKKTPEKGYVLFETGYGPSGLPHIGTFGEVVRTLMVRLAFQEICDIKTKLFCVSDDMDGLRKIPDNIPNGDQYQQYLDMPLTNIPDPFGEFDSYGHYMNAQLRKFLDKFGFDYEFISATEYYKTGRFNKHLQLVLEKYDKIMQVILPTLGPERRETYSPFLPVCTQTGKVLQAKVVSLDEANSEITYVDAEGKKVKTSILNGACKLQWKADFAMRWAALDVDYEIYGKDIKANAYLYDKICAIIGKTPPQQMNYELFLDENGQKISKSKGNGLTIDEWLRYGHPDSLKLFMYQSPKKAKKLSFDVIPKTFDEYLQHLAKYNIDSEDKYSNPAFFIHQGKGLPNLGKITYSLILNLINALNSDDSKVLWGYIEAAQPNLDDNTKDFIDHMLEYAGNYYRDFVVPKKKYKTPEADEVDMLNLIVNELTTVGNSAEEIQAVLYKIARESGRPIRECFKSLYQILLGTEDGPRMGSFISFYGIDKTIDLIKSKLG
jgi:lysyl-tRNA synthetase class 1